MKPQVSQLHVLVHIPVKFCDSGSYTFWDMSDTRFCDGRKDGQTDGRTNRRPYGQTDKGKSKCPPPPLRGGHKKCLLWVHVNIREGNSQHNRHKDEKNLTNSSPVEVSWWWRRCRQSLGDARSCCCSLFVVAPSSSVPWCPSVKWERRVNQRIRIHVNKGERHNRKGQNKMRINNKDVQGNK